MSNFIRVIQRNVSPPVKVLLNIEDIDRIVFYDIDKVQKADFIMKNTLHTIKNDLYEITIEVTIPNNDVKTFVESLKKAGININVIE